MSVMIEISGHQSLRSSVREVGGESRTNGESSVANPVEDLDKAVVDVSSGDVQLAISIKVCCSDVIEVPGRIVHARLHTAIGRGRKTRNPTVPAPQVALTKS